jgi:glutaredoxin
MIMDFGKIVKNRSAQYLALAILLFAILLLLLNTPSGIVNKVTNGTCTGNVTFEFFYLPSCPHCQAQESFNTELEKEFPQVTFIYHNIENESEAWLLSGKLSNLGQPADHLYTPTTFICDRYFVGYESDQTTGTELRKAIEQVLAARKKK